MENHDLYPETTNELAEKKAALAPKNIEAWRNFSKTVFEAGALDEKTKQLIAIAVAHVTQCPYCIRSHTKTALRKGATKEEVMEAIWVAAEMRAGAAYAHATIAMDEMENTKTH
ncbi:carboxymuconolactone decarboxylase family protein [Kaistella daneshvariae]|jgi:AhpD family alkylhydroperoxidase|uniref:Carboxymuconolactone decarboxylase family protein n=1 Tax=Kaistella daneshvariae TaxID=2487074 RepID=A0A3N0WZC1_9FLAO|nr:carboxymuconolactone decarboxylase family protein [Kaistella daneshvariae]AZI68127.1 carboxymuconolactone decarboxylase family protein [Kaistella daneshvariae]ROI10456.1 carboxymuconolactone decarboxylase family protein [Kaistella daneshvariae]